MRWKSGSLANRCVQPGPTFQASPGDQILKLVDHYLLRSYGERDIRLLKHRSQRRDIEALGKCATVGFHHFVLDFCKGFGFAKTLSVFQHETDRCASRSGLDEYPLPDLNFYFATRTRPEIFLNTSEFRFFPNRLFPSKLL